MKQKTRKFLSIIDNHLKPSNMLIVATKNGQIVGQKPTPTPAEKWQEIQSQLPEAKETDWFNYSVDFYPVRWGLNDKLSVHIDMENGAYNDYMNAVVNTTKQQILMCGFKGNNTDGGYFNNVLKVGDTVIYDSWNFGYEGKITKLTAKTVFVQPSCGGKVKRMKIKDFTNYNWHPQTIEKNTERKNNWYD